MLVVRHLSSPLPPGLLLLLHRAFARIAVVKPVTSRPASSERCARAEENVSSDGVANETQNDDRRTEPRLSSDGVCVWRARMGGAPGGLDARGW